MAIDAGEVLMEISQASAILKASGFLHMAKPAVDSHRPINFADA
jgi:hypothetical protein